MSYCKCDQRKRRGGDDCSIFYCLNDCSSHGLCNNGICECEPMYYGLDCSTIIDGLVKIAYLSTASTLLIIAIVSILLF